MPSNEGLFAILYKPPPEAAQYLDDAQYYKRVGEWFYCLGGGYYKPLAEIKVQLATMRANQVTHPANNPGWKYDLVRVA